MVYQSKNNSSPDKYTEDHFKELFSGGLVSPVLINQESIIEAYKTEALLATAVPVFEVFVNDPLGKKRMQWNNYLRKYFAALLGDNNIQNMVYTITEGLILKYINSDPDCDHDELTSTFAEYIVKEIGSEAYESKIRYSITAMINTEKRPHISQVEVCRHLAQMFKYHMTFKNGPFAGFSSKKKIRIEIYSEYFNEAYLLAVAEKLSENIYRNVAVNLLDRMVEKLLEMTIDMFNKEQATRQQSKVSDKIQKLKDLKKIIDEFD